MDEVTHTRAHIMGGCIEAGRTVCALGSQYTRCVGNNSFCTTQIVVKKAAMARSVQSVINT